VGCWGCSCKHNRRTRVHDSHGCAVYNAASYQSLQW
jgi:hypothetical protein